MGSSVDDVAGKIRKLINDDGFLGTSRNDHLQDIRNLLKGLSPGAANEVIGKLSDSELRELASDINSGGVFGAQGLSQDEKKDLFNLFSRELDGTQFRRVADTFSEDADVNLLSESVAQHGTPEAKLEHIRHLAEKVTGYTHPHAQQGNKGEAQAEAIGDLLVSLKNNPEAINKAVAALNDAQLGSVLRASTVGIPGARTPIENTSQVGEILSAVATGSDPAIKARAFEAGAKFLTEQGQSGHVTQGLSDILNSDNAGVRKALGANGDYEWQNSADFPLLTREQRVSDALQARKDLLEQTAAKYGVDPRAIAAAITWEFTENPRGFRTDQLAPPSIQQGYGWGQIHASTLREEMRPGMGLDESIKLRADLDSAIDLVGSRMRQQVDAYRERTGIDLSNNPEALTWLFNTSASSLDVSAAKQRPILDAGGQPSLEIQNDMAKWTADHIQSFGWLTPTNPIPNNGIPYAYTVQQQSSANG